MTGRAQPWWFPTAMFVAPAAVLLSVGVFWLVILLAWLVHPAFFVLILLAPLAGPSWIAVDLARREDRHRDPRRPPGMSRWGPEVADYPGWWSRYWQSSKEAFRDSSWLWAVLLGGLPVLLLVDRYAGELHRFVWWIWAATVGVLLLRFVVMAGREKEAGNPAYQAQTPLSWKRCMWRWPVTCAALGVGLAASGIAVGGAALLMGNWTQAIPSVAVVLLIGLPSLQVLTNPDSPWRNYGRTPGNGATT
ncbi:MAG: hypothetical protein ACRDHF_07305 [Tepidiformaceae bacterium]